MGAQAFPARHGLTDLVHSRVFLIAIAAIVILCPLSTALAQSSTPVDVGWRDFSFGNSGTSDPTGEKPESKLWWNDGLWWGCLYNDSAQAYHIYRLSLATQSWTDTGTVLDDRNDTNCDTLWDQTSLKLYVVSHILSQNAGAPAPVGQRGQLYRYSYNTFTKIYTLDSGFPIEITGGKSETLVVAKDSVGTLWATYTESQKTMVNHSLNGNDLTWGTPFSLPVTDANNLDADDVCSIIAYNGKVGVLWSNQNTSHMYFGVHIDGDSDQLWQSAIIYSASADDHMNVKAAQISASGGVVAAIKTSQNAALMILLTCTSGICATASDWHSYTLYDSTFGPTRPSLLVDTDNRELYFFTRNKNGTQDAIYYKRTSMDNIQFTLNDIGTPFIVSSATPASIIPPPPSRTSTPPPAWWPRPAPPAITFTITRPCSPATNRRSPRSIPPALPSAARSR